MLQALISFNSLFVTVLYIHRKHCRIVQFSNDNAMMHGLDRLLISSTPNNFLITYLLLFFLIKLQNMYQFSIATKNTRIVRFCNVNAMMHGLVGSFISLMHINFLITVLFIKQQN